MPEADGSQVRSSTVPSLRGSGAIEDAGRIDVYNPDRGEQPRGFDRHHLADVAVGELGVPAKVNAGRLVAADPHPEQLVVAADVEFLPGDACRR